MKRVAIKIAYLGKDFFGSQYQPGLRTVMGDILFDLHKISGELPDEWFNLKASSRTDGGVNALENVVVFNTTFEDNFDLLRALNLVSKTIFYRSIATVDDSFNPRFANERIYRYVLPAAGLDFEKAKECASLFLGEHDFRRFCKPYDKYTVTTIDSIEMVQENDCIIMTFHAQYFLWNMIRKISAAIRSVAKGRHSLDDVRRALNGDVVNFGIARPDALTLTEVNYDDIIFEEPPRKGYSRRVADELFSDQLKDDFLRSL